MLRKLFDPSNIKIKDEKNDEMASDAEIGQMRSVIGSLGRIARQCRPDLSYHVSRHQGAVNRAKVKDLKETNLSLAQAQEHSEQPMRYLGTALLSSQ